MFSFWNGWCLITESYVYKTHVVFKTNYFREWKGPYHGNGHSFGSVWDIILEIVE